MKKLLLIAFLFICSNSKASTEAIDRQQVFKIMKDYTKLTSCMNSFEKVPENGRPTTLGDVHTVEYDKENNSYVFYVLWGGDKGCAGDQERCLVLLPRLQDMGETGSHTRFKQIMLLVRMLV